MVTWTIENMERTLANGMVIRVSWRVSETDGDVTEFTCNYSEFETPGDPFVPYEELTEEQVLGWVQATDLAQSTAADVHTRVQAALFPTVASGLPW